MTASSSEPEDLDATASLEEQSESQSPPDVEGVDRPAPGAALLPAAVRTRVVAMAADALGALPTEEVPPALRAFARFTPSRRARLAALPLSAALETDEGFRAAVAERLREALPLLAAALEAGTPLPAAPPEDLGAAAYLLRPAGWESQVSAATAALAAAEEAAGVREAQERVAELAEELERVRAGAREESARLAADLAAARAETEALRRQRRDEAGEAKRAVAAADAALSAAQAERDEARNAAGAAEAESRRARARASEAESALEAARRARREGRDEQDVRLRVLLDTLLGSATGLRRELALAPVEERPADAVADALAAAAPEGAPPGRALAADDPVVLNQLLAVPGCHLLVDGYNVTMAAYGGQTLESQRGRLLRGLGALASRTGVEITCVFDGADVATPSAVAAPRNVRLLFSPAGTTADEVLRQLVRAEPQGRPLVVVSSDREVADGVRIAGAKPVPSAALLRLLDRS